MQLRGLRFALAAYACVLFGCDDPADPRVPGSLAMAAGDAQLGRAGTPLAIAPAVRVLDDRGAPLPGTTVEFAVLAGGGSVEQPRATTDVEGIASAGAWSLGPGLGENTLTATVPGLAPVTFTASAGPGAPARIVAVEGDGQSAPVGERLPVVPVVRATDAFGNATPAVPVRFATVQPGGRIGVRIAATDAEGIARAGAWTLDTIAGAQTLRASIDDGPALDIHATAIPARAVAFDRGAPAEQTGTVGEAADAAPAVIPRDRYGNAVPGTAVRFAIIAGEGTLYGGDSEGTGTDTLVVTADQNGRAAAGRWILGTRAGIQGVRASIVDDTVQTVFAAHVLPGPPSGFRLVLGQDQTAQAGTVVAVRPTVAIADDFDNPIVGLPVTFTVGTGGGIVNLGERATDDDGIAAPLSWILGPQTGPNTLIASAPGLPDAVFRATATPGEPFEFEFFFIDAPPDLQDAMRLAARRWQDALIAGQPDADGTISPGFCGPVEQVGPYDDLRLILLVDSIDGPGRVLASAGPCAIRAASRMPVVGGIALDAADVQILLDSGQLIDVLVHEIGHILGIGTRWGGGLLLGSDGNDPYFTGGAARDAFLAVGGSAYSGAPVPVENTGGAGTRNGHWRESIFDDELMTGFLNPGANPLSIVSLASLQDVGYLVDMSLADPWHLGAGITAQRLDASARTPLRELPWPTEPVPLGSAAR